MSTLGVIAIAAGFVGTLGMTALTRSAVLRLQVVAEPNARSSHDETTASAGGIGFVVPMLALIWLTGLSADVASAVAIGGIAMALVGFVDDCVDLASSLRLVVHVAACGACLWFLMGLGGAWGLVFLLGYVWFVNLYNFMDGIDGIAASQAVAYAVGMLVIAPESQLATFFWLLAAVGAGFLVFNWAPARIFMGDVGSGFLGIVVGAAAIELHVAGEVPLVTSLVLLSAFWFDATYTLCVRIATGQRFTTAHRSHLYQIVARRFGHGRTTSLYWIYWTAWLLPLSYLTVAYQEQSAVWLVLACMPLLAGALAMHAGRGEETDQGMTSRRSDR